VNNQLPYYQPLAAALQQQTGLDQGDPFILEARSHGAPYQFYIYTSNEDPQTGRAVPCYGTNDFTTVDYLGCVLHETVQASHWAPTVIYRPTLEYPYVMLYSHGQGFGEQAHIGHQILRAHSKHPHGPFLPTGHVLTPEIDFSIDAEVYQKGDKSWWMAWALDFVHDPPIGTGVVEAPITPNLMQLVGEPQVLVRAWSDEQLYEANRFMPWKEIPPAALNAEGRVPKWHTVEAPVAVVAPSGRRALLFSGGCFYKDNYHVGTLVEDDAGRLVNVTQTRGHYVMRTQASEGLFAMAHPSALKYFQNTYHDHLVIHTRFGSLEHLRQMMIVPLWWTADDLPYCPTAAQLRA
jgi:hypothetical protein